MNVDNIIVRLAGAFRNAVVWGGAWFTLGAIVAFGFRLGDGVHPGIALADAIFMGMKIGFIGGVSGAAFAGLISVFYRGRRLSDLSWLRFGIGGAIMAGLFVPAFLLVANLVSGEGFAALRYIIDDGLMAAVFAGITAAGSLKLAQRANAEHAAEPFIYRKGYLRFIDHAERRFRETLARQREGTS